MSNEISKSEDMQQEAIEVGMQFLVGRGCRSKNVDNVIAQEAMDKFTVEKVRSDSMARHDGQLTLAGHRPAH